MSPTFADLGVSPSIVAALAAQGIKTPFPIQAATLVDSLAGRDVCGRAPTGSGKTIAFGIPLVEGVGKARPNRPQGLVLVPTRELATQVANELRVLSAPRGPRIETFFGGTGFDRQLKALHRGVDIAVACPGRLADLVGRGSIRLDDVELVVVDEADRMADMGFLPEVRRLLDQCHARRQTMLFSATLDGDVDVLIKRYQHNPARHELAPTPEETGEGAEHFFWAVERGDRVEVAADVIARAGSTVVFCRTKHGSDRLARQLESRGVRTAVIHGNRSQSQRERALSAFHQGKASALVATDVAARGIHVDNVACVLHFDLPADSKDYVHRSGRTARAGATGIVVSLVPGEQRRDATKLQRTLGLEQGLQPADPNGLGAAVFVKAPTRELRRVESATVRSFGPNEDGSRSEADDGQDRPARSRGPRRKKPFHRGQGPRPQSAKPGAPKRKSPKAGGAKKSSGPKSAGSSSDNRSGGMKPRKNRSSRPNREAAAARRSAHSSQSG